LRGKDPFNPTATKAAETLANGSKPPSLPVVASSSVLALKGIILGSKQRRLAVINNRDFAVGDTSEVTIPGGKLTVHCVEIGDGYVVVTVAGVADRHLLRMRQD
jgi:type II secretory pathway component PulC